MQRRAYEHVRNLCIVRRSIAVCPRAKVESSVQGSCTAFGQRRHVEDEPQTSIQLDHTAHPRASITQTTSVIHIDLTRRQSISVWKQPGQTRPRSLQLVHLPLRPSQLRPRLIHIRRQPIQHLILLPNLSSNLLTDHSLPL